MIGNCQKLAGDADVALAIRSAQSRQEYVENGAKAEEYDSNMQVRAGRARLLGRPFGVDALVAFHAQLVPRHHAAAPRLAGVHPQHDRGGIIDGNQEGATGVDDHRRNRIVGRDGGAGLLQPFHPRLLAVAEIHGVVHVTVGVHVAPPHRNAGGQLQFSGWGLIPRCFIHRWLSLHSCFLIAAPCGMLYKCPACADSM